MNNISQTIRSLKRELDDLMNNNGAELSQLSDALKCVNELGDNFEKSWLGGWGQNDVNEYLDIDSGRPLNTNLSYFYKRVKRECQLDLNSIDKSIIEYLKPFKIFQQKLIVELSVINDQERFKNENELLAQVEKFQWGLEASAYIKMRQPNHIPIYDYSVLSRGLDIPPHISVLGQATSLFTKAVSAKMFNDLANRTLRQVELKIGNQKTPEDSNYTESILTNIFDNFHSFFNQLRNRYNSRPAIEIQDEYDVQDLLHSILKLHFKDIREEEYTPSYAGSSTRMDFLLKNENIVIEVKKTRDRLLDKEVGEQLILDVAHYKNHPNCNSLKCFVYDPENKIKNPRGLENDIKKLTDDNMSVELFIRP